jgi:ERCC4-related helicase
LLFFFFSISVLELTNEVEEILTQHFKEDPNSRAIVFADFRESVVEIVRILDAFKPAIKAASFIGQASSKNIIGLTQKEQQSIIDNFVKGVFNVLVATCIGEEGLGALLFVLLFFFSYFPPSFSSSYSLYDVLDIGEVNLIICFDAQASPIRMIQRMGRTGRKRNGKCVILASEGSEVFLLCHSILNVLLLQLLLYYFIYLFQPLYWINFLGEYFDQL